MSTRGTGATFAEATAIHYWGEDNGSPDDQGIVTLIIGQYWNVAMMFASLPFAGHVLPQFIAKINEIIGQILGQYAFIYIILTIPIQLAYVFFEFVKIFLFAIWALLYYVPTQILYLFLGINDQREEDIFTWFLNLKELGIYDGATEPYTNDYEIPEAYEQWVRHFDTGAVYGAKANPDFADYIDEEFKRDFQESIIEKWYRIYYPEAYTDEA